MKNVTPVTEISLKLRLLENFCKMTDCSSCPLSAVRGQDCGIADIARLNENLALLGLIAQYEAIISNSTPRLTADAIAAVNFNHPYTEVVFVDGTVSRVKCAEDDTFNEIKGVFYAFLKAICVSRKEYKLLIKKLEMM